MVAYEGLESIVLNKKLRAIGTLYPEDIHIVVRRDSGIKSLKDMIGKKSPLEMKVVGNAEILCKF